MRARPWCPRCTASPGCADWYYVVKSLTSSKVLVLDGWRVLRDLKASPLTDPDFNTLPAGSSQGAIMHHHTSRLQQSTDCNGLDCESLALSGPSLHRGPLPCTASIASTKWNSPRSISAPMQSLVRRLKKVSYPWSFRALFFTDPFSFNR